MVEKMYDIIVIGAGSAGLSVGLTMNKIGFKVLMISKTESEIGGECLNDGCIPSKALIHVSRIVKTAKKARAFGLSVTGFPDFKKAIAYVYEKQEIIRKHEDAKDLRESGIDVVAGPYPVASRVNQHLIVMHKQKRLSPKVKKILQFAYKIFS